MTTTIGWPEMHTRNFTRVSVASKALTAAVALSLLALPLAGCAPEPGTVRADGTSATEKPDGTPLTEKTEPEHGNWQEPNPEEALQKQQELPAGFPEAFTLPSGAQIDDAGERSPGSWYVVLKAQDQPAADALWEAVITTNSLATSEESETSDGRSATLSGPGLRVMALTLPDDDGGVLLSYDVSVAQG